MKRRKMIIFSVIAALVAACATGVIWLVISSGKNSGTPNPTDSGALLTDPTTPANPTTPSDPIPPSDPIAPSDPGGPTEPSAPTEPVIPGDPEKPKEDPDKLWGVEILVTREDGSVAKGAAVIATHSSGRQEYEATDEKGIAVLNLPKGQYAIRVFQDGQQGTVELEIGREPVKTTVQLKDERKLYILFETTGSDEGDAGDLQGGSVLVDAIMEKYPDAIYLTSENRYDYVFRDGDALLTIEILVENYTSAQQYFASELWVDFKTYQECITVWDTDENGEELEMEYADGNMCSIKVRNEYDYDYKNGVSVITESYYSVQKDLHLSKYSSQADVWGYHYTMERVLSNSADQRVKAPGAGMKLDAFFTEENAIRYRDYLAYAQQLFPYVDLWMSGDWNAKIEQLTLE